MNVTLADDYVPTVGDTLQLINCGKRQGTFSSVTLNGYTVAPIYSDTAVQLRIDATAS